MKVYFMRHGESEYNLTNRINYNPSTEVNLTLKGKDQAERVAATLAEVHFDAVFSSEFLRAKATAAVFAKQRKMRVRTDKRLNEFKYGFEGENASAYHRARKGAQSLVEFRIDKSHESFLDVKDRLYDFLTQLKTKKFGRVLIVTHEAVIQAARALFNELNDDEAFLTPIKNVQYFIFDL